MRVILFGATGGTGRAVIEQAARRGHQLTAFVRSPEALGAVPPGVTVVKGDAFEAAAVIAAIRGHDAVISALGTRPWRHTDICSRGTANIIAGMKAHDISRIVAVSSLGVAESRAWCGFWFRAFLPVIAKSLADKAIMEASLRASELDWIVVRPTVLRNGRPAGHVRAAVDGSIGDGSIRRTDVAAFCIEQLMSDLFLHALPVIAAGRAHGAG